jgi:hypothetical protein
MRLYASQTYVGSRLEQGLTIKKNGFERSAIHSRHASKIHDMRPWLSGRFGECVIPTVAAKIMFRPLWAKLIHTECAFFRFHLKLRVRRHEMQQCSSPGAEGAVAAHPFRNRLAFKREANRTAVATAFE